MRYQTFNEAGSYLIIMVNRMAICAICVRHYQFGMQDDVRPSEPTHGDYVVSQFASQLDPTVADNSHLFLIDVDFGTDLSALVSSSYWLCIGRYLQNLFLKPSHINGVPIIPFIRYSA